LPSPRNGDLIAASYCVNDREYIGDLRNVIANAGVRIAVAEFSNLRLSWRGSNAGTTGLRMRARNLRGRIWAARLGLLALALNALVPIHIAFDLAEAFAAPAPCSAHAEGDDGERHLLGLLTGHRDGDDKSDEHGKHHACPVCSALGDLAGFAPPAPAVLSAPLPSGLPAAPFVIQAERVGATAAYRSRAPPIA
jgi:hypothetical protein